MCFKKFKIDRTYCDKDHVLHYDDISCFLILGMLTTLLCIAVLLDLHSIDVYCCLVGLASSFTVLIRIRVSFDNLVR